MTDNAAAPVRVKKSRLKIFLIVLPILLLLLAYGVGIILLPVRILTNYQSKNCDAVLSLHRAYTNLYPKFVEDQSLSPQVQECEAYTRATLAEEQESWRAAYEAYRAYGTAYPAGLFAKEAHKRSASVLMSLAQDQIEQNDYEEALANLTLITLSYSDTDTNEAAWDLFPSLYTARGTGLRHSGEYQTAEKVFIEFKTWSQRNLRPESETAANQELAQTYLAWGQEFQSRKLFEEALAKFDLAVGVDPNSQFDSAAQVKTGQRNTYVAWGNDLLDKGDFPAAIQKLELAVSRSEGKNEDGVSDALTNGYIQWAANLRSSDDFIGALKQLDMAKTAAQTGTMKQSVDSAFEATYLAFSQSDGEQAQQAMKDTLKAACEKGKAPSLPIFGLNKDVIGVGIYGVEAQLLENVAAKTPGELHFVACIDVKNITLESRHLYLKGIEITGRGYHLIFMDQFRTQLLWHIQLLKIDTTKRIAETTLKGGPPPSFAEAGSEGGSYLYGPPPTTEELSAWLQSVIR